MKAASRIVDGAHALRARGYLVVPVVGKRPISDDWPSLRLDGPGIDDSFDDGQNVGVILGASGLADLDFDDHLAIEALHLLAPKELAGAAIFEHNSRPHLIVRSENVKTRRFRRQDQSVLVEVRGEGAQTVFPPSVHPDGKPYQWVSDCDPCSVDPERLVTLACMIATTAHASEFWDTGSRHDIALALAGFLLRRVDVSDAAAVVSAAAHLAGDPESEDRANAVRTTGQRRRTGMPTVGLPTLANIAPELATALDRWWRDVPEQSEDEDVIALDGAEPTTGRPSQADALVTIGKSATLFHDGSGVGYARIAVNGHSETWPLRATRFKNWLRRQHYAQHRKAPGNDAVSAACGVLEGIATFDGPEHDVHNRVARVGDAVYYDLADGAWRAVIVEPGTWKVVETTPIIFRRFAHQRPQVEPARSGDLREALRFVNVRSRDQLLLLAWLVAAFIPDIPHPMPDFHGEKGAAKSTGQRVLRRLIDPSSVELLGFPRDVTELVQQLSHHYAPVYDNVDQLPPWISDVLCRAVTGEGFSKRELYSDDDDVIYSYRRIIMLNGVNVVPQRSDLLDRSLLLELDRIGQQRRREERAFWAEFEEARPRILGGIFDVLAEAMRRYCDVRVSSLERMADFTHWGAAISEVLGLSADDFLRAYSSNRVAQTTEAVEGDVVGTAVLALMRRKESWSGTPTELLRELEAVGEAARLFRRSANGKVEARRWPGAAHVLTRRLNEIRSNLLDLGIQLTEEHGDERIIGLTRTDPQTAQSSVGGDGSDGWTLAESGSVDATDATDAAFGPVRADGWELKIE